MLIAWCGSDAPLATPAGIPEDGLPAAMASALTGDDAEDEEVAREEAALEEAFVEPSLPPLPPPACRAETTDSGRVKVRGVDLELDIGGDGAGEAPDLRAEAGGGDQPDRLSVVVRDAREARLDPVDAGLVESARELELHLGREHDGDGVAR